MEDLTPEIHEFADQIRPCTANDLVYRAFRRPYQGSTGEVLYLLASGWYTTQPWEVFFQATYGNPNRYTFVEKVPRYITHLTVYVDGSYTSGLGLAQLADTVTIVDAYGEHQVTVEPLAG